MVGYVTSALAAVGAAMHENDREARAEGPAIPTATAFAASTSEKTIGSTESKGDVSRQKVEKWKEDIMLTSSLSVAFANIKKTTDSGTKLGLQSALLIRIIKAEMPKALEPENLIALQEIAYELAIECGNYKEAIEHHRITNDKQAYAQEAFVQEEVAFLTKAESLLVNQYPTKKKEIASLLASRRSVLQALANPDLRESKHAIGIYLFFECDQEDGLPYIAAAEEHLAMAALAKDPSNPILWEMGVNKVPPEWRKAVAARAAKLKNISNAIAANTGTATNPAEDVAIAQTPSAGALPQQAQPKAPLTVASPTTKPLTGRKFNAFQFTNPARYSINGKSGFTPDGKLFLNTDSLNGSSKILFPMIPSGNFNIRAEIDANQGRKLYRMVVPVGSGEVWLTRHANKVSLHQNDGALIQHEEKEPTKKPLELRDTTVFDIDVIDKREGVYNVIVRIDGAEIFNELYKEVPVNVNKGGMWILTKQSLGIWASGTNLNANSYVITAVNGRPVEPVR